LHFADGEFMVHVNPRTFGHLAGFDGLSERCMREHIKLYEGYVGKYNDLMERLRVLRENGRAYGDADPQSLKVDITFALSELKNHELFFDILGNEGGEPRGELAEAIVKSFRSVPQYLVDLKQAAMRGRGWAWTAYDLDYDYLFNYESGPRAGIPVWNVVPIVAIDLAGHAYFYDFGSNKGPYVDAVIQSISWGRVGKWFEAARTARGYLGRSA
jgi:Fe-Mn family superoxide dismutase